MLPKENRIPDKKLRKATIKAFKSVEKMIREEPHPIVIGDIGSTDSDGTVKEITGWLFHRSHNDDSERNTNSD